MNDSYHNRRHRRAFTLLELTMVLAVMTAIVALGVPSVSRMLARARFKDGVFALQAELSQTRLLAMKTGQAYLFRCLPQTDRYLVVTKKAYEEEWAQRQKSNGNLSAAASTAAKESCERTLPPEVCFLGSLISDATSPQISPTANLSDGIDAGSAMIGSLATPTVENPALPTWSEPVVFYPNGRTSNAVFFLASTGTFSYYSEISLRGFTGGVRVSSIATVPPGDPAFPSVLSSAAFARLQRGRTDSTVGTGASAAEFPNARAVSGGDE